jgi:hypothetical protein
MAKRAGAALPTTGSSFAVRKKGIVGGWLCVHERICEAPRTNEERQHDAEQDGANAKEYENC